MKYFLEKTIYFIFYFLKKKTKPLTGWPATPMGGCPASIWSRGWSRHPWVAFGSGSGHPGLASGVAAATLDEYFGGGQATPGDHSRGGFGHPRSESVVGHPWVFFFFF
jgi:hypothetical protein